MNLSFAKYQLRLRDAPFPSPRPSPRGRGRIAARSGTGPDALVCRETPAAWLPLPKGEGRGEGKQDVSQPDASDVRRFRGSKREICFRGIVSACLLPTCARSILSLSCLPR